MSDSNKDYYCNQKFWWLSIDLSKRRLYSCCSATPSKIDVEWLKQNPGKLFNTPMLQQERQQMLNNEPVKSCFVSCWEPENKGILSRRLRHNSQIKTHIDINAVPTDINLLLSNHCNLTCVYCCKQYSSAWFNDINQHGSYLSNQYERFQINPIDVILSKTNQRTLFEHESSIVILNEITELSHRHHGLTVRITGGEPFLHNDLLKFIDSLSTSTNIIISTGLGLSKSRISNIIDKLIEYKNISLTISGESVGKLYEAIRYGNSWQHFENNVAIVDQSGIPYRFQGTVSNLTLTGIPEFHNWVDARPVYYDFCNDPSFLSIHVVDKNTKEAIANNIDQYPDLIKDSINSSLQIKYTQSQYYNFVSFFKEFCQRRGIDYSNLFSESFVNWINMESADVV